MPLRRLRHRGMRRDTSRRVSFLRARHDYFPGILRTQLWGSGATKLRARHPMGASMTIVNDSPSSIAGVVLCVAGLGAALWLTFPVLVYWTRRGIHRFKHRNDHENGRIEK